MFRFDLPVSFHDQRTLPLSDIAKNFLRARSSIEYKMSSLELSTQGNAIPLRFLYDYGLHRLVDDITLADRSRYSVPLTLEMSIAALGLKQFTTLRLEAIFPRPSNEEPYEVVLHFGFEPMLTNS